MTDQLVSTSSIPDRGPAVFAVTTATLVVGTVFLIARLICRCAIVKRVSWDDYFIILAWFLITGLSITIDISTSKGLGKHDADIDAQHLLPLRKTEYVFSVLYNPALMALKTSILIFYLRLSKNTQQVLRITSWVVLAIVNVAGAVLTLMNIFQCRPVMAAFSPHVYNAQCIPLLTEFICSAPVNIVTDLAILALPIPVLTGMRLPGRQKYILVFTFSLGIFVTIVDVIRIYYLQQAITSVPTTPSNDPQALFGDSPEFAWNASLSLMWSAVELNVGLICACIPTLKPLIVKILPAVLIDPDGTRNSNLSTYATGTMDKELTGMTGTEPPNSLDGLPDSVAAPLQARQQEPPGEDMSLEFLTMPEMVNSTPLTTTTQGQPSPPRTRATWMSGRSRHENAVYFGFVNMKRPKSMIKTSPVESLRYCIVVTILFLLWGFSYGLLDTLNTVIASVADMSTAETLGLTSAYFGGGYFFGPIIVGEWVLRHDEHARFRNRRRRRHKHRDSVGGFKATFITGLSIYGIGTIMFWPCAVLASFPGFMISNFVVGFGLGVLETAANPFIILCGPREYAETRILIAQGCQGVATVISGLLAQKIFFVNIGRTETPSSLELIDVQWTYLAITLFCVALALFFYYMPLPEVTDDELGQAAEHSPVDPTKRSIGGLQLRTVCIIFAVTAQWMYTAAQESMSVYFKSLMTAKLPDALDPTDQSSGLVISITDYLLIAHAAFAISRFVAALLAWLSVRYPQHESIPTPRTQLTIFSSLSILFAILCVVVRPHNSNLVAIPAVLFFFAEGPIFPLIFVIGLRGQGKRTKRASAWLTMGASGPMFWPFVMYGIVENHGASIQLAFVVPVVLLVFTVAYPVFLTVMRDAKDLVDPVTHGRAVSAGGGMGGGEESGGSGSDGVVTLEDIMQQNRRRSNATKSSASRDDGPLAFVVGKIRTLRRDKRREAGSPSTGTASSSPMFEHQEVRRENNGGLGQGERTPPTIPEEHEFSLPVGAA
ncbi:L-fucose-proton symporter [Cytospora mali]|uniref:L-fucose-proton symporter n=1 Tax=Cytospora mali TaxID=578113 RepID=A0A194WCV4_CYTMA|nr:L-fucose-proton symporter [Valsa mali]